MLFKRGMKIHKINIAIVSAVTRYRKIEKTEKKYKLLIF